MRFPGGPKTDYRMVLQGLCDSMAAGASDVYEDAEEIAARLKAEDEAGIPFDLAGAAFRAHLHGHLASAPPVPTEGPQRGYQQPVTEAWRRETLFNFKGCTHTVETIVEIENEHGKWGMAICVRCANVNLIECPHVDMEWHLDGQLLICRNCGIDGT